MVVEWPAVIDVAARVSVGADGTGNAGGSVATDMGEGAFILLQVRLKVGLPAEVGTIVTLPLVASVPLQSPDALQLESLPEDQYRAAESPSAIVWAPEPADAPQPIAGDRGGTPTASVTEL